jgi:hypothetical protein
MANENINIPEPVFCLGPQSGTFCYISSDTVTSRLVIVSSTGSFIRDFTLSSRLLYPIVGLEYVGPKNLTGFYKGLTFFTAEVTPSGVCYIKRWEIDPSFSTLNLKQIVMSNNYNAWGIAVEHYNLNLSENCQGGIPYIEIADTSRVENGMSIFLGPSSDADNPGAIEFGIVSYVSGNKVYFTGNIGYQYVAGNKVSFYKNIYVLVHIDDTIGKLAKHKAYDGSLLEYDDNSLYASAQTARWSQAIEAVALVFNGNMLFKRPYDYYLNWKSMNLNNELNSEYYTVYDIVFDDTNIYKLMRAAIYKDDTGVKTIRSWSTYNYQQDTLLPYTNSINIHMYRSYLPGYNQTTRFFIQARDQFGVTLRDVNINLYRESGDSGSYFSPLNGQAITDINGGAEIGYLSGSTYTGATTIKVKADKSSSYTGSQYVWNSIKVYTNISQSNTLRTYSFSNSKPGFTYIGMLVNPFKVTQWDRTDNLTGIYVPAIYLQLRTFFTTPRRETPGTNTPSLKYPDSIWFNSTVSNFNAAYWPWLDLPGGRKDGPPTPATWQVQPTDQDGDGIFETLPGAGENTRAHYIKQIAVFKQIKDKELKITQMKEFLIYKGVTLPKLEDGVPPFFYVAQADQVFEMFFSQLKMSKHSYVVDGINYTDLLTNVKLNQFIFVADAVPAFWSEKNPIETYIWIRLRPFAFDLDNTTFRFWVREVWSEGEQTFDTGLNEVTSLGTITNFNAGGNILGIEFMYQPADVFHYGALVFIHLEVYDKSGLPNFIYLDYWFKIIPDFKSPYLVNLNPAREEQFVPTDTDIYFEIKDDGAGIDITTLEVFINSRTVLPTEVVKISDKHYTVKCDLPQDLLYNKTYAVNVIVSDISPQANVLRDSYRFYTRESDAPYFTDFDPKLCLRGMSRFHDVAFTVLADEMGVDKDSIRVQVSNKDVTDKSTITPIIYRIS